MAYRGWIKTHYRLRPEYPWFHGLLPTPMLTTFLSHVRLRCVKWHTFASEDLVYFQDMLALSRSERVCLELQTNFSSSLSTRSSLIIREEFVRLARCFVIMHTEKRDHKKASEHGTTNTSAKQLLSTAFLLWCACVKCDSEFAAFVFASRSFEIVFV